jgi:hypothetical protein
MIKNSQQGRGQVLAGYLKLSASLHYQITTVCIQTLVCQYAKDRLNIYQNKTAIADSKIAMVQMVHHEGSHGNHTLSVSLNKGTPETVWNMLPPYNHLGIHERELQQA